MALSFSNTSGEAQKSSYLKYQNGINKFRLVGGVLARYVYWLPNKDGKNQLVECLSFDRAKERFTNIEKNWVEHYFPDENCSWSYLMQCIDLTDGKIKIIPLKKKFFQAIVDASKRLGDPTATDATGWDVVLERKSTGSQAYNVEYNLQVLDCENRALTEAELALVAEEVKDMESLFPRPTPEEQKMFIEGTLLGKEYVADDGDVPEEVAAAFNKADDNDVPF